MLMIIYKWSGNKMNYFNQILGSVNWRASHLERTCNWK